MTRILKTLLLIVVLSKTVVYSQTTDPKYMNEIPPGITPKVFAPGKVSTEHEFEFGAIFSKDHSEFYYGVVINGKAETRVMKFLNGKWSKPEKLLSHEVYSYNDPFLTPDNQKLFFISDRALSGTGPKKDYDIWYIEREGSKWSAPKNAGTNINSSKNEYYMSFTRKGKMYFSSNRLSKPDVENYDIYTATLSNGNFLPPVKLGSEVNTTDYEADVFVAPDESYLVFAANRPGGLGSGDLHVSFKDSVGEWTKSISLGDAINTESDDFCPFVTADGKYLFYASRGDIYWVSTAILKELK